MHDERVDTQHTQLPSPPMYVGIDYNVAIGQLNLKKITCGESRLTLDGFKE